MNLREETLLKLSDASRLVGKHVATIYRWTTAGVRGVVLETLQVGGTRCTTHEALQRFCELLTGAPDTRTAAADRVTTIGSQTASEELARHGI
ncbi:MAG: DUF1580 domain-containing protein [Planctomycetota bacterium]